MLLPAAAPCLLLLALLPSAAAVKSEDFKRCDQSGFCARNRAYADASGGTFHASALDWSRQADGILTAELRRVNDAASLSVTPTLQLTVTTYTDSTVRVQVDEKEEPQRPRYRVRDVLVGEGAYLTAAPFTHSTSSGGGFSELHFGDGYVVRIGLVPFTLHVFVGGEAVLALNHRGFFQFEHYRQRPAAGETAANVKVDSVVDSVAEIETDEESIDEDSTDKEQDGDNKSVQAPAAVDPLAQGMWEETFGTHKDSKPHGPASIAMDVTFLHSDNVYGIPQHAANLSLKTTRGGDGAFSDPFRLYNLDVFEYELDRSEALYGSVPFMVSHARIQTQGAATRSQSVGFFWLNAAETWVDITKESHASQPLSFQLQQEQHQTQPATRSTTAHWMSESGAMDFFLLLGPTPKQVQQQYGLLTGTSVLPAQFALGYHQCRWNYVDTADVQQVHDGFNQHDIPVDVLWLDIEHTDDKRYFTWHPQKFADPQSMLNKLAAQGRKMVTIVDPHIKRTDGYYVKDEASEKGLFVQSSSGAEYDGWCWPGSSSWVDYTNPAARKWWAELFRYEKYVGSSPALYTWNDMNEPSVFTGPEITMPKDNLHWMGWEHRDVHNIYGMYLHRSTYSGHIVRSSSAAAGDSASWSNWLPLKSAANEPHRPFVLSRAFFAGTQRYGAIWTGDNMAQWSHLAAAPPMLLSISLAGVAFCGADVGGFFGNPDAELLTRWYQAGAYYPFFRGHAHIDTKRREPWLFGDPYTGLIREAILQRYRLLPYWYSLFRYAQVSGVAPMRPMFMEFPEDDMTFAMDDQYMVGEALLVKPVSKPLSEGGNSTSVYLPLGVQTWFNVHSLLAYSRPSSGYKQFSVPLSAPTAALQRAGTVIPQKLRVRRSTAAQSHDPLTLSVALNSNGRAQGQYYLDAGDGFAYASRGEFSHKLVTVTVGQDSLAIAAREILKWSPDNLEPIVDATEVTPMKPHQQPFMGDHHDGEALPTMTLTSSADYRKSQSATTAVERITLLSTAAILQRIVTRSKKITVRLTEEKSEQTVDAADHLRLTHMTKSDIYGQEAAGIENTHATWKLDIKVPPGVAAYSDWEIVVPF